MPIRFQVDGDFYDHPKTIDMSDAAVALWTRAGSYSAAKLTDGFLTDAVLVRLSQTPDDAARELVKRGLWRRVRGGYRFHQWDERNLSRARVEAERTADRQRKRRERQQAHQNGKPQATSPIVQPDSGPDSTVTPNGFQGLSVSESLLVSVSGSGRGAGPPENAPPASTEEPPPRCPSHLDNPDPPPCGACAEARKTLARWKVARAARIANAPKCRIHRGQLAHNCALCRAEELNPA